MSIQFRCGHCGKRIEAPDTAGGKKAKCPVCGCSIAVPSKKPDAFDYLLAGIDEFLASDAAEWHYRVMGETIGPLTAADMRSHVQDGRIQSDTYVRKSKNGNWRLAGLVTGLFDHPVPQAPPPPPPTPLRTPPPRSSDIESPPPDATAAPSDKKGNFPALPKFRGIIAASALVLLIALTYYVRPISRETIVARTEASVAHIYGNLFHGTGFLVDSQLLITNRHVIEAEPDTQLRVTFPSRRPGALRPYSAVVVYEAPNADLAILELEGRHPYLRLRSSHEFRRGQEVTVIGNPGLDQKTVLENAVSRGILSTTAQIDGNDYYQLDISVNPGNSGGPVLDSSGHVIGVLTLRATESDGLGFCIPLAELITAINETKGLSESEKGKNSSMHNFRAVTRLLAVIGDAYLLAMATYIDAMNESILNGERPNRGLFAVQPTVNYLVSAYNDATIGKIESEISRLGVDPNIPESACEKFVEAWTNYKELKRYVEVPRVDPAAYGEKYRDFYDKHVRLIESLNLLTGVHQ
jgi:S1-C subfamily serine protease/DNA-directed RNA polymerase subunit RPC12/RpoP